MAEKRTVASVLAKLAKEYQEAVVDVDVAGVIKGIQLDSPSLNFIFGGQFPKGRIYEFYGPESGGKSTLATYIAGEIQKKNDRDIVIYVDIERSFDKVYANRLGLDTDPEKFILLRPLTGEEGFTLVQELIKQLPVGLIIWDSLASTPSHGQMEDPHKSSYGGTAAVFAEGLKTLNPYLSRTETSMIVINQERAAIGGFNPVPNATKTTGGYAIKFYASWRGRITKIDVLKEKGKAVGITMRVRNVKNKAGVPFREAELNLFFETGFNSDAEYITFMINLGLLQRGGSWYNNEQIGMHVQGRAGVEEFFRGDPDMFAVMKTQVDTIMMGDTIVDRADLPEDLAEEEEYYVED